MPAHVKNTSKTKYSIKDLKAYYKAELRLAKRPALWREGRFELEMFFDTGHPTVSNPPHEFVEFCQIYDEVRQAAAKVGIEETLTKRMLRALARNLYYGSSRQDFYIRFLEGRIENIDATSEPYSMIDIEERYQYYLYRKENHHKGRGIGPRFSTWKKNGGCPITFYSIMQSG